MRKFRKKYNSLIAVTFLFAYSLLFTANLFHVHHYDISQQSNSASFINYFPDTDDPFALGTSICFLEHICCTMHLDNFTSNDILFFKDRFSLYLKPEPGHLSGLFNNLQNLRAPPSFC